MSSLKDRLKVKRVSDAYYDWSIYGSTFLDEPDYEEEQEGKNPMKKHWTFTGSSKQYETRVEAEEAAKKSLDRTIKTGMCTTDIAILEAVACVKFPIPAYEVVDLAKA